LVGAVDMVISFMRVEGLLPLLFSEEMTKQLGRATYRGNFIHYPLIGISLIIAFFSRSLGFTWLALLIVLAEFQIVVARFIFSYEQAFMGDLVRFWYAALFLFASAYTLIEEGHVRVDIIYAGMSERRKAWSNVIGSILLGVPLCWIIMTSGMWDKSNLINAPLLSFEVTQSGYGLYVKYLMAGFLLIYALTMMMQFLGYTLRNAAVLANDPDARPVGASHGAP
ncbi:MAG: TRAP transporter small permease subunit, partial [Alphaproteobacteria bacterium]|nr:TRAP transporter small permease subunit [Alphaproteobacteria bacterium]